MAAGSRLLLVELSVLALVFPSVWMKVANQAKFWHISDIHLDEAYSVEGSTNNLCHKIENENKTSATLSPAGDYKCDSPLLLAKAAFKAMENIEPEPDFILWTGDSGPHNNTKTRLSIANVTSMFFQEIKHRFKGNIPVVAALGNHDSSPSNSFSDGKGKQPNKSQYYKYYSEGGFNSSVLGEANVKTFLRCGYYTKTIEKKGFSMKFVVLNTNLYYNNEVDLKGKDPCDQLKWLNTTLQEAKPHEKVYLVGHVPPGGSSYRPGKRIFTTPKGFASEVEQQYMRLVTQPGLHEKIVAHFYGHLHIDTFRLFLQNAGASKEKVAGVGFIAGSVKPNTWSNPSIRLFQYNQDDGSLTDYAQYGLIFDRLNWTSIQNDYSTNNSIPRNNEVASSSSSSSPSSSSSSGSSFSSSSSSSSSGSNYQASHSNTSTVSLNTTERIENIDQKSDENELGNRKGRTIISSSTSKSSTSSTNASSPSPNSSNSSTRTPSASHGGTSTVHSTINATTAETDVENLYAAFNENSTITTATPNTTSGSAKHTTTVQTTQVNPAGAPENQKSIDKRDDKKENGGHDGVKEDAKLISAIAEKFVLIYKAKDAFRVTDLSIQEMTKAYNSMVTDRKMFDLFYKHSSVNHNHNVSACNQACYRGQMCTVKFQINKQILNCMNNSNEPLLIKTHYKEVGNERTISSRSSSTGVLLGLAITILVAVAIGFAFYKYRLHRRLREEAMLLTESVFRYDGSNSYRQMEEDAVRQS